MSHLIILKGLKKYIKLLGSLWRAPGFYCNGSSMLGFLVSLVLVSLCKVSCAFLCFPVCCCLTLNKIFQILIIIVINLWNNLKNTLTFWKINSFIQNVYLKKVFIMFDKEYLQNKNFIFRKIKWFKVFQKPNIFSFSNR